MISRRHLLAGLGAAATVTGLTACSGRTPVTPGEGPSGGGGKLTWWDHFQPLQQLQRDTFAAFEKSDGVAVEYTVHQTAKLGQALQLAKQSNQLPDVHTNVGLEIPVRQLIADGWYQPLQLSTEVVDALPAESKVEGVNTFDGKLYSFPLFNFRQYWAATWFNRDLLEKAGLDPAAPPATYDDFRAACAKIKDLGTPAKGWINNLGAPGRIAEQVNYLVQAAGFAGTGGRLFATGELAFTDDVYANLLEFWLSLKTDGHLVEGSFDDTTARTRWAAGQAAFYMDGPWCPGSVQQAAKQFLPSMDVGPMLVPEAGMPVTAYRGAADGTFYISASSDQAEVASRLLEKFLTPEYAAGLATQMDQPPADLTVIDRAEVHESYRKAVKLMGEGCFLAPQAVLREPEVSKITAKIPKIKPDIGTIVQGLFAGEITDIRKALKEYQDKVNAATDKAFADAKAGGSKVDQSVFAFDNFEPRTDYTSDKYDA
ncbi:ABC transporter substrate-binding protein [Propionibacteriaceae bacterium Y1685]